MKIEKVHIKNIKGIKDLELSFKKDDKILDLIVLAGINGSGKTTILEAIKDFFYNTNVNYSNLEKSNVNLDIFFEDFEKNKIEEAEKSSIDNYEHKLQDFFSALQSYNFYRKNSNDYYQNQIAKRFDIPPKIIYGPAENKFEEIQTYSTTLSIEYEFINTINSNVIRDIPSYIATRRNYLATIEEDLTMKEITNKVVNEINDIFNILELDVKLKGFSKDEKTMPIFENSAGEEFDINDLSSGEKQLFLRTLSIKMLEPKNSIILIDEPELSLHPKWQQRIVEVYKKIGENNQIIVATHSPHILGSVSNENIFILYRNENGNIEAKTGDDIYSSYGQPVERVLKDIMGLESVRAPKIEKELEMKEILYEEICSHYKDHTFTVTRGDYYISVDEKSARIEDEHTGEKISYS